MILTGKTTTQRTIDADWHERQIQGLAAFYEKMGVSGKTSPGGNFSQPRALYRDVRTGRTYTAQGWAMLLGCYESNVRDAAYHGRLWRGVQLMRVKK